MLEFRKLGENWMMTVLEDYFSNFTKFLHVALLGPTQKTHAIYISCDAPQQSWYGRTAPSGNLSLYKFYYKVFEENFDKREL